MNFKATESLDFREDMFGSVNMLLCGKQPNYNFTKMTFGFPSPTQMANNMSTSSMGNSSGRCRRDAISLRHAVAQILFSSCRSALNLIASSKSRGKKQKPVMLNAGCHRD